MAKYEFVGIIDPTLSNDTIKDLKEKIKSLLWNIEDEDDIGLLELVYPINKNDRWYFVSYLVDLDPKKVNELRDEIRLMKGVMRFFFYKMGPKDKFLKFAEVNKQFELTEEEKAAQANAAAFQDADAAVKMWANK